MDNIFDLKQKKVKELDQQIAKKALELGWDDGSGTLDVLGRLATGTATELEKRRADKMPIRDQLEALRMLHDRSKLIRDLDRMKSKKPEKNSSSQVFD